MELSNILDLGAIYFPAGLTQVAQGAIPKATRLLLGWFWVDRESTRLYEDPNETYLLHVGLFGLACKKWNFATHRIYTGNFLNKTGPSCFFSNFILKFLGSLFLCIFVQLHFNRSEVGQEYATTFWRCCDWTMLTSWRLMEWEHRLWWEWWSSYIRSSMLL